MLTVRDPDTERRETRYTGPNWDAVTADYEVWLNGRVIGYAPTPSAAWKRIGETPVYREDAA